MKGWSVVEFNPVAVRSCGLKAPAAGAEVGWICKTGTQCCGFIRCHGLNSVKHLWWTNGKPSGVERVTSVYIRTKFGDSCVTSCIAGLWLTIPIMCEIQMEGGKKKKRNGRDGEKLFYFSVLRMLQGVKVTFVLSHTLWTFVENLTRVLRFSPEALNNFIHIVHRLV